MTNLEKAKAQLDECGVDTHISSGHLYVYVGDMDISLELSDFEINFRANLYDEEQEEQQ